MLSDADDLMFLASAHGFLKTETRANQLSTPLVRLANGKQLTIAPQKFSVTLFTSVSHKSWLHSLVQFFDKMAPLNRTKKNHAGYPFHLRSSRPWLCQARFEGPKRYESFNWGFLTETIVGIYKTIVRPIVNYANPALFTKGSSS